MSTIVNREQAMSVRVSGGLKPRHFVGTLMEIWFTTSFKTFPTIMISSSVV